MDCHSLKSLFLAPRSVVFVGIPRKTGPGALNPIDNLRNWGYQGRIEVVHPHVNEIAGVAVTRSVSDPEWSDRPGSDLYTQRDCSRYHRGMQQCGHRSSRGDRSGIRGS